MNPQSLPISLEKSVKGITAGRVQYPAGVESSSDGFHLNISF
jgi:hypothetical protein